MPPDPTRPYTSRRATRARERALVLLLCGCALLLPPGALAFHVDGKITGIPIVLGVLFVIWALLIVFARASARSLTAPDPDEDFGP